MFVLIAPPVSKVKHAQDFIFTSPGELVYAGFVCDRAEDKDCGCERSFSGATSHLATSIAVVAERDVKLTEVAEEIAKAQFGDSSADFANLIVEDLKWLYGWAGGCALGTHVRTQARRFSDNPDDGFERTLSTVKSPVDFSRFR